MLQLAPSPWGQVRLTQPSNAKTAGEAVGDPRIQKRLLANGEHSRRPEQSRTARPIVLRRGPLTRGSIPRRPTPLTSPSLMLESRPSARWQPPRQPLASGVQIPNRERAPRQPSLATLNAASVLVGRWILLVSRPALAHAAVSAASARRMRCDQGLRTFST